MIILTTHNMVLISGGALVLCLMTAVVFIIAGHKADTSNNAGIITDKTNVFKPKKNVVYRIDLPTLSELWRTKNKDNQPAVINIKDLSYLWKDESKAPILEIKNIQFNSPIISNFYTKHIDNKPYFTNQPLQLSVCLELLNVLDKYGHCPSVVDKDRIQDKSEEFLFKDINSYNILRRTSLSEHTINVCENIIEALKEDNYKTAIPNFLIAGLGHDIGKIENVQGDNYVLGDHPLTAGMLLTTKINGFNDLSKKDDILNAVKLHHKTPEGLIGETLKQADQKARQEELEKMFAHEPKKEFIQEPIIPNSIIGQLPSVQPKLISGSSALPQDNIQPNNISADSTKAVPQGNTIPAQPDTALKQLFDSNRPNQSNQQADSDAVWKVQQEIYGIGKDSSDKKKKEKINIEKKDISAWFDEKDFIEKMKDHINKVYGTKFMAVSMKEGYVYFQTKVLEKIAREQASKVIAVASIPKKDDGFRAILLSIVEHFRDKGFIAKEFVQEGYFGGYFNISFFDDTKTMRGFYTPFHAEVFGRIGDMEANKPPRLKNIQHIEVADE